MFCLSGSSGTGKSTTISFILKELEELKYDVLVTSPTHKAKFNLEEMIKNAGCNFSSSTIHSYLNLTVKNNTTTGKQDLIQRADAVIENYDILVVEESSMISAELLAYIKAELELNTFAVVIFLGDPYQLLGVGENESPVFNMEAINDYKLLQVQRQALENPLIKICTAIRDSIISKKYLSNFEIKELFKENLREYIEQVSDVKSLLDRYFKSEYEYKSNSVIAYKNKTCFSLNSKIRNKLIDDLECFTQGEDLIFLNALVEDDKVIIANNETVTLESLKKIHDNSLGIDYWKLIDTEGRLFRVVDFASKGDYDFELTELAQKAKKATGSARSTYWQQYFALKETFQDVAYVYCGTTFKSQGSSYNEVFYHMDEVLSMRQTIGEENLLRAIYVGTSRCKHKLVLLMR